MWQAGEELVVRWEYFLSADEVNIDLYEGGTAFREPTIYEGWGNSPETREFIWMVPDNIKLTTYAIRLTNVADASEFVTSPLFTIASAGAESAASYTVSGGTLVLVNSIAMVFIAILVGIAYCYHDERGKLKPASVFFIILSVPDLVLDCFWVHERNFSSDPRGYFIAGLLVLVGTCVLNVVGTVYAIWSEKHRFEKEKFRDTGCGLVYPFIAILCFTNTDCLMLLPWEYKDGDKDIADATGFPTGFLLWVSFLRLLEDVGQAIVQAIYLTHMQGGDALTIYSLIFSFAGIAYIFVCKIVAQVTSSDGRIHPR